VKTDVPSLPICETVVKKINNLSVCPASDTLCRPIRGKGTMPANLRTEKQMLPKQKARKNSQIFTFVRATDAFCPPIQMKT